MKIDPKLVGRWLCEWAALPDYYTTDALVYIAQRAADHALEEAAKQCEAEKALYLAEKLRAMKGTK